MIRDELLNVEEFAGVAEAQGVGSWITIIIGRTVPIQGGVLRPSPEGNVVGVQDAGLSGVDDPRILEWAAQDGRVLAFTLPGLVAVGRALPMGKVIADIL